MAVAITKIVSKNKNSQGYLLFVLLFSFVLYCSIKEKNQTEEK